MQIKNYRYVVAVLLFLAGAINYMDRAALGIVAPLVNKELGLSSAELGVIFSSFFVGYSLFAFVGGQLADRYGPRRVFSWAMGSWSVFCGLTAVASGFVSLLAFRALFGFAEGPMNSTTNRSVTDWFPRRETSSVIGFTMAGQSVGSAIAGLVVGLIATAFGWRTSFVVIAGIGIVWIVLWRWFVADTPEHSRSVSAEERALIRSDRPAPDADGAANANLPPLRSYLLVPATLSIGLALFAVNYSLFVFLSWMPSYLSNGLHLNMTDMSVLSVVPWACGGLGFFGGGVVADVVYRRMRNKLLARKLAVVVPLALSGSSLVVLTQVHTVALALTSVALAVLFLTAASQACFAVIHEVVPPARLGGVTGFVHLISNLSGVVGPTLMGLAIQYAGGYNSGFLLGAVIDFGGVLVMSLMLSSRRGPVFRQGGLGVGGVAD